MFHIIFFSHAAFSMVIIDQRFDMSLDSFSFRLMTVFMAQDQNNPWGYQGCVAASFSNAGTSQSEAAEICHVTSHEASLVCWGRQQYGVCDGWFYNGASLKWLCVDSRHPITKITISRQSRKDTESCDIFF